MAGTTIGKAYVQIMPSMKGVSKSVEAEMSGVATTAGAKSGKLLGAGLLKGIGVMAIGTAIVGGITKAVKEGAKLQQSYGGIETLYKDSADKMKQYASESFRTVGMSANEYMENVTSFSAALLQGLGGDTSKAADVSNMAMQDMSDNMNKFGSNMEDIKNAYQGFSKQNYTMLDNLKLGYGGTKTEMQRLLADAQKLTGVKYDISNLSDVYNAIHAIQENMGITGTTAKEAGDTVSGSFGMMKSSALDLIGNLAMGQNVKDSMVNFIKSFGTFMKNLMPMIGQLFLSIIQGIGQMFVEYAPILWKKIKEGLAKTLQGIAKWNPTEINVGGKELMNRLGQAIKKNAPKVLKAIGQVLLLLVKVIVAGAGKLALAGATLMGKFALAIISAAKTKMKQAGQKVANNIKDAISNGISNVASIGQNLVSGIWTGIVGKLSWIKDKIKGWVGNVIAYLKRCFKIASPSKVMRDEIGKYLPEGIAVGVEANASSVTNALDGIRAQALNTMSGYKQVGTAATTSNAFSVTMNVSGAESPEDWGNRFISELNRRVRMA